MEATRGAEAGERRLVLPPPPPRRRAAVTAGAFHVRMDAPANPLHRLTLADRRLARRSLETEAFARRLSRVPGIASVVFDACAGTLLVAFDAERASPGEIRDRLREAGLHGVPSPTFEQEALEVLARFGPALPRVAAMTAALLRA